GGERAGGRGGRGGGPPLLQRGALAARAAGRLMAAVPHTGEAARAQEERRYAGLFGRDLRTPDSFWVSLRYFNLYRMAVAALFLGITLYYGDALNLGSHPLHFFRMGCVAYLALGVLFHSVLTNL